MWLQISHYNLSLRKHHLNFGVVQRRCPVLPTNIIKIFLLSPINEVRYKKMNT